MSNNPFITVSRRDIQATLNVLRSLDVRGYDSMYKLVATVEFFEGKLNEQPKPTQQKQKPVDHEFGPRLVEEDQIQN